VQPKTHFLLLRWDTGKVGDRCGGLVRFKGGLRGKGRIVGLIWTSRLSLWGRSEHISHGWCCSHLLLSLEISCFLT